MKNPFGSSPTAKLEQNLAQLRVRRDQLTAKRVKDVAELEMAQSVRQAFLLEGDLDDTNAAEGLQGRCDTAVSTLAGVDAALATLDQQIVVADKAFNDEKLKAVWLADSKTLAKDVDTIHVLTPRVLEIVRTFGAAMQKVGVLRFEAGQIGVYAEKFANEVETAMAVVGLDLDGAIVAVAEGREKLPKPPPVLKVVAPTPPASTVDVFLTNPICWTDEHGVRQRRPRYTVAQLSPELAAKARELACTVAMTHPMVKTHGQQNAAVPEWHHCTDLTTGKRPTGSVTLDLPKPQYRPPSNLTPTDRAADLSRLPRAAARNEELPEGFTGFEPHPRMKAGP